MARERGVVEEFFNRTDFKSGFFFGNCFNYADGGGFSERNRDEVAWF